MTGSFSYLELHTREPAKAKEFYKKLFDWKTTDTDVPGFGTYTSIEQKEGPGGGLMKTQAPGQPSAWAVYMNVDNLAAANKQVATLGGKVLQERIEVPGQGTFSVIVDPTGAVFNLWQKAA